MIQIKKTILTLVALLAVTTGAWAEESETINTATNGKTVYTGTHFKITASLGCDDDGIILWNESTSGTATIEALNGENITKIEMHMTYGGQVATYTTTTAGKLVATNSSGNANDISVTDINATSVTIGTSYNGVTWININKFVIYYGPASAASGPEVTWTAASKTGSFTMPGGNVTLEPDYYPQATAAEGAVTAADADARATTDDPLVKVDATKLTGAKKLMYFVSNSGTTAPAYDAVGWTDQLPTAEGFTQQGIVYVWYYPVGIDEGVDGATATYSDGDICLQSITARIAAAPTYAVTFADDLTEPDKWTASPATGVTKGQTVTVTYTGSKKVLGVKAEKKAAAPAKPLANATAEDLGKIAGADGNIYDTKAAAEAANTTAVAMIAYVGSASDCTHGLAIALADESGTKTWSEAGAACSGKTAVTGGTWRLPSIKDWQYMFIGCGASGSYSDSPSTMSYSELATKLTTANGTALQTVSYWSSTESSPGEDAWSLYFGGSSASFFSGDYEGGAYPIRSCLAF